MAATTNPAGVRSVVRVTWREPLAGHVQPDDFRHRAACRSVDPEVFFPATESGRRYEAQVRIAKAVCAGCPVQPECLTWALSVLSDGVAGGMTEHERRVERARRSRARRRTTAVDAASEGESAPAATGAPSRISHINALAGTAVMEGHRS